MAWLDRGLTLVDRPLRIENIVCQKSISFLCTRVFFCPCATILSQMQAPSTHKRETVDMASCLQFLAGQRGWLPYT